jgi:hypothetical protein
MIKYDTINKTNNDQLIKLERMVTDLENTVNKMNKNNILKQKYTRVKSLNNGMELNLLTSPNANFTDRQTGSITPGYMVNVNNGCISVGANDYDVYKCNDKNNKQIFKMEHILNDIDYNKHIDKSIPIDNVDKTKINYPFAMIKSINNENCLTNNHGVLTVQPCYSYVAQRWMPL